MDKDQFVEVIQTLEEDVLEAVLAGESICLVDDEKLKLCNDASSLDLNLPEELKTAEQLREWFVENAEEILQHYYRLNPLTRPGFDLQVKDLFEKYGPASFVGTFDQRASVTLFVEVGTVVAEEQGSARHPYGSFCEIDTPMNDEQREQKAAQWLTSGEAYDQYLSMNVCRYNC